MKKVQDTAVAALTAHWGPGDWFVSGTGATLNRETLAKSKVSVEEAARVVGEAAMTIDGILGYVTAESAHAPQSIAQSFRLSYFPHRGPDVFFVQQPFSLWNGDRGGTTHGTPYTYDTHVPLIFYGSAFRAGTYPENVSTIDLAPTLAAALGINSPSLATGSVLTEALRAPHPAAAATAKKP